MTNTINNVNIHIIKRHLSSFMEDNNLEAVVSDYTDESILITQDATYTGPEEIRTFFADLMVHFPKRLSSFELDKLVVKEELAYIVWHANTPTVNVPYATDTFIVKNGKIHQQTFACQWNFIK